ncbi:hypothetical protein ACFV6F_27100 [Kitasatospora phosalacinea]|uniref:hypothetical protein n=1 Tax=Kitasatospora phosalacinea TaxID=2065 RepID=UPI003653D689
MAEAEPVGEQVGVPAGGQVAAAAGEFGGFAEQGGGLFAVAGRGGVLGGAQQGERERPGQGGGAQFGDGGLPVAGGGAARGAGEFTGEQGGPAAVEGAARGEPGGEVGDPGEGPLAVGGARVLVGLGFGGVGEQREQVAVLSGEDGAVERFGEPGAGLVGAA